MKKGTVKQAQAIFEKMVEINMNCTSHYRRRMNLMIIMFKTPLDKVKGFHPAFIVAYLAVTR
ncbi:hypothetical protein [Brevibacillus laterosporus]|uniref:hypothetical protein n=1 Tax=Brevibacillus laterosporus TaxID=1465 RepID=UPI00265CB304|nr:hypothetical protein [Brevibacillus laterosporus]